MNETVFNFETDHDIFCNHQAMQYYIDHLCHFRKICRVGNEAFAFYYGRPTFELKTTGRGNRKNFQVKHSIFQPGKD